MKERFIFVVGLLCSCLINLSVFAKESIHVVVVGVDGLGGAYLSDAKTPHIDELKQRGSSTVEMQNVIHPVSSPNWMSMIAGSGPSQHGVLDNDWKRGDSFVPKTIFRVIKDQRPEFKTALFYHWSGLRRLIEADVLDIEKHGDSAEETMTFALEALQLAPEFTFIHLDSVDGAGHSYGWGSHQYTSAIEHVDRLIGLLIARLKEFSLFDKTVIVLASDHGGDRSHSRDNYVTRSIPFLISGPSIVAGQRLELKSRIWDIAPTIAQVWKLDRPSNWIGSPLWEVFVETKDKLNLSEAPQLEIVEQNQYEWIYDDRGTGAFRDLSIWRPKLVDGFSRLAHVVQESHDVPDYPSLIVKDNLRALSSPVAWEKIASDKRSGGTYDVVFWRAIPKRGYICLGDVAHLGYHSLPALDEIKCVHHHYLLKNKAQYVWDAKGAFSKDEITIWSNRMSSLSSLAPNSMLVRRFHGDFGYNLSFAIKRRYLE